MKLRIDSERITEWLSELVAIDSVNPDLVAGSAGEERTALRLADICIELGLETRVDAVQPGRSNVIAHLQGPSAGPSLLLCGHTDVVGVEGMSAPFTPRIADGRLYGRGTLDMKGGLAAILGAVHAVQAAGALPPGDLWLGFVCDEEYGSIGAQALVRKITADAAVITEPTGLQLCIAHKGFAWITLEVQGRAAHGSRYAEGRDAIAHAGLLLADLQDLESRILPGRTHPLLGRPSAHAGTIEGGLGWSTYPDRCTLRIEHRLLPDEHPADWLAFWEARIARRAAETPGFQARARLELTRPGYALPPESQLIEAMRVATQAVLGRIPATIGLASWQDSAILGAAGIPTLLFGPGGEGAHAAEEFVILEDVFSCAEVLAHLICSRA